jgi:translation initiation factor IF-2
MSKLRVYMVAKELGTDNKSLVALFQSLGVDDVKNHMSAVSPEQVERAKRQLAKGDDRAVESRVGPSGGGGSVIIRRGKKDPPPAVEASPPVRRAPVAESRPAASPPASAPQVRPAFPAGGAGVATSGSASSEKKPSPVEAAPASSVPVPARADRSPQESVEVSSGAHAERAEPVAAAAVVVESESTSGRAAPAASGSQSLPRSSDAVVGSSAAAEPSSESKTSAAAAVPAPAVPAPSREEAPSTAPAVHVGSPEPQRPVVEAAVSEPVAPPVLADEPRAPAVSEVAVPVVAVPSSPAPVEERPVAAAVAPAVAASTAPDSNVQRTPPVRGREVRPQVTPPRPETPPRPSSPPKTGIDVWQGRPGVPMPQAPRGAVPRRVQYDAKVGAGAAGGQRRGPVPSGPMGGGNQGPRGNSNMRGGAGGARRGNFGMLSSRRPGPQSITTQERAAHKKVVKIEQDITLQTLAARMGAKAGEVLMKLMSLGVTGVNINSTLDSDTAKIVAEEFGWTVEDVAVSEDAAIAAAQGIDPEEDPSEREPRPPVVTVMGHVDHGKTSLLDKIRRASVAAGEAGGITQHIGAYSVKTPKGRITFMDTPGHAAFTQMRARGAKATDLIVLVVAADDGVMPQTKEAINHARDARCPIVVAVNKIDKPDAQPERVRRELSDVGLMPEEWGGHTLFVEVSAQTGQGIENLLDAILLQSEMLALTANPKRHARGTVIEAKLDRGRGPVATILVTEGTLRKGDGLLVGNSWGKVRAMLDDTGRSISEAGPSMPVAVIGLSEVPSAGDMVDAVQDSKKAQQIAEQRRDKLAERGRGATSKVSLEELARRMSQTDQKELKVIVKGDVQGTVEALNEALEKMSTEKVRVNVVHTGVGAITEGDVNLAVAARAIVIGFNTRPAGKASLLALKEGIEIRQYSIIYDVTDDIKLSMEGLLAPTLVEEPIGEAEVRKIFKVTKAGVVAGCMVIQGVVRRNSMVRLRREKEVIWEGKLDSLKRFKDDAKEVREGFDCGISFAGFSNLQEGDIISAFELKEVRPTL